MTKDIIMNEINNAFSDSRRDAEAKRLTLQNVIIRKDGRWWYVNLFGKTVKIYCSAKYCYSAIHLLLNNNAVWAVAKQNVKDSFRNEE